MVGRILLGLAVLAVACLVLLALIGLWDRYMISGKRANPTFSGCVPSWISKPCRGAPSVGPDQMGVEAIGLSPAPGGR
jgi:hypothetical protein